MAISSTPTASTGSANQANPLVMRIIAFCALAHLVNDLIQSVLPAIYPMLKANYDLSFAQIGMITLTFQITASLLQPWVGFFTDRRPTPNLLPLGTLCTLVGIVKLPDDSAGFGTGRHRFVDLPPGDLADRAAGLGWPFRPGAVDFPGWR